MCHERAPRSCWSADPPDAPPCEIATPECLVPVPCAGALCRCRTCAVELASVDMSTTGPFLLPAKKACHRRLNSSKLLHCPPLPSTRLHSPPLPSTRLHSPRLASAGPSPRVPLSEASRQGGRNETFIHFIEQEHDEQETNENSRDGGRGCVCLFCVISTSLST